MKSLLLILFILSPFTFGQASASENWDSSYVTRLRGVVNFGPYINCDLRNRNPYELMRVLDYRYTVSFVNRWNQVELDHHFLKCTFGCDVGPYQNVRLTGPRNGANVIGARCEARVRVFDYHHPHDDYVRDALHAGGDNTSDLYR